MEQARVNRRLAAIMAADMVGYSRLMESDESSTIAQLKVHRKELIDPKIAQHHGHVLKRTGDGALVEFDSVVDAVVCAVEIQHGMARRNEDVPTDLRIEFRIGIDIGDVVFEDDDFHGTGVIKAARLEGLAEPGGVNVARAVYDRVKTSVDVGFESLGERPLKNLAEPVEVFRVVIDGRAGAVAGRRRKEIAMSPRRPWRWAAAAFLVFIVGAGGLWTWDGWLRPPPVETTVAQPAALRLPDKPSIAVLPFVNLSDDARQEYFVDGMTEDLITDLAKVAGLFVISSNSVFTYKGQAVNVQQVAQELGVRYVLEGSVRRAADTIRVNAQLVDARTGGHLWAERYDRELDEVFAVQDEIKQHIVAALAIELSTGELAQLADRPTESIEAYEYYLRGRQGMDGLNPGESIRLAYWALEQAVTLDPNFAEAHATLAMIYAMDYRGSRGWNLWVRPPERARAQAVLLAGKALALAPDLALPELVLAHISLSDRQYDQAIAHVERAIIQKPGDSDVYETQALILTAAGRHEHALLAMDKALRLDPNPPAFYYNTLGRVQFALHDYVSATQNLEKFAEHINSIENWWYSLYLYASYAYLDRTSELSALWERASLIVTSTVGIPQVSLSAIRMDSFYRQDEDMDHYLEGLRKAGVTEYPYGFQPAQHADQSISGEPLRNLLYGHSFHAIGRPTFLAAQIHVTEDGLATWLVRHDISDTSPARIAGDGVCFRFPNITRGREACYQVFHNSDDDPALRDYDYIMVGPDLYYFSFDDGNAG